MNVLICISSKYPNPQLYDCINSLYKIQINQHQNYIYKIIVLDSDSDNFINYLKIKEQFPKVNIHMIKNKNYEYGAWKYSFDTYPNFDIYFCIFILKSSSSLICILLLIIKSNFIYNIII